MSEVSFDEATRVHWPARGRPDIVEASERHQNALLIDEDTYSQDPDEALLTAIKGEYWFLADSSGRRPQSYADREPVQRWQIQAGGINARLYNYDPLHLLEREHVAELAGAMGLFGAHFQLRKTDRPTTIAIAPQLPYTVLNDSRLKRARGMCWPSHGLIELSGLASTGLDRPFRHELPKVSEPAGLMLHELAHIALDEELAEEWRAAGFSWTPVLTPTGKHQVKGGQELYVSDQPEACVSQQAQINWQEDICDSVAAYLSKHRQDLNPSKRAILNKHDAGLPTQDPVIKQLRPRPPLLPKTIYFRLVEV